MIPMMIASLPALCALPLSFPSVSWIPSDICADALRDIVLSPRSSMDITHPRILHLANPKIVHWPEIARQLGELAGIGEPKLLSMRDYVDILQRSDAFLPIRRLLPYLLNSIEEGTMPEKYSSLDVSVSLHLSPSLASCPPVTSGLLNVIVQSLLTKERILQPSTPPPVFMFGPWSAHSTDSAIIPTSSAVEEQIMTLAQEGRKRIGDCLDVPE